MSEHLGFVDHLENGWLFGWAAHADRRDESVAVDVLLDGERVATHAADRYRADLESAGLGGGRHAFEIELPAAFQDGEEHEIRVVVAGTQSDLAGSPRRARYDSSPAGETVGRAAPASDGTGAFRSRFGGLWTDRVDAADRLASKLRAGEVTARESELLARWIADGFVVLEQAVPHDWIDALDADIEAVWQGRSAARCYVEYFDEGRQMIVPAGPHLRDRHNKLLDVYDRIESARPIVFAPAIERFLSIVFEQPLVAFQGLYFRLGSKQAIHQDSAFVKVSEPRRFAASWVALEDIREGSGELLYYVGSHRLDDYLFEGRHKWMPFRSPEYQAFIDSLRTRSEAAGLRLERFLPRKGDALLWSADLAHGGSPHVAPGSTRKSLVTHYCPLDCTPIYGPGETEPARVRYSELSYFTRAQRD
jgi:phytanoyl-CoA hydroxylase